VAQQLAAGANPWSVVTADFNGDGIPDLAVANFTDSTVTIMLGNGDGTFRPIACNSATAADCTTGTEPISLAVGDFNHDGKLDLAMACLYDNAVAVLLGNGDGTFQNTVAPIVPEYTTGKGTGPYSIAAGAFVASSSTLDLVVADSNTNLVGAANEVSILIGNGDGTFQSPIMCPTGTGPTSVAVGDLNGDGILDLAVANFGANTVSVLLGTGNSTSPFQTHLDYATGSEPISVAIGYFNGSHNPPSVVTANNFANTVSVLPGSSTGALGPHVDYATGSEPTFVTVGDVNGDGNPDLAVADESGGSVSVLLGRGNGTFRPHSDFGVGISPRSLALGDFNGDHKLDLAVANTNTVSDSVSILLDYGSGSFQDSGVFATGSEPIGATVGDFNGDNIPDLAMTNSAAGTVSVLLGNRDGTFKPKVDSTAGPTGSIPYAVAVGDFNADQKLDLAVINEGADTVSILLGNGDGTFQAPATYSLAPDSEPVAVAVGKLVNGSSNLDLIVADLQSDTVAVLMGNGDGTFQSPSYYTTGNGPRSVAVGDVNKDGKPDVVVANSFSDTVSVLLGTGQATGTLQSHTDFPTGSEPVSVAVGNFNNDGNLDVVTANAEDDTVSLLLGNGTGALGAPKPFATGAAPHSVAVVDFNGDGHPDVAVANLVNNSVSVLLGTGTGSFQARTDYPAGPSPYIAVTADFNLDGAQDLAAADNDSSTATVILNTGGTHLALTSSPNPSSPREAVQFTATIARGLVIYGQSAPTGSISFYNGATLLGSGTIASGSVSISNSTLPAGSDSITAVYSGDANFNPHTSAPITQTVSCSGCSTVSLSPTSLTFSTQFEGTTSKAQTVTLTNTGTGSLSITNIVPSTNFGETNTCPLSPSTLAAGANCTISVTFTPTTTGTLTGTISVTDNASGSPQAVSLTGTGTVVKLSPASGLNFGTVTVGTTSSPMTATVTNGSKSGSISITGVTFTGTDPGDFAEQSTTCGSSLGPQKSCTVNVTFTPTATGKRTALLSVSDNGGGSPQTVGLQGTGQ
jgi:hypothetical protein